MAEENKMDANNTLIDFIINHSKEFDKYKPYVKGAKTRREARNRLIQSLEDMEGDEREKFLKGALVRYNEKLGENEPKFTRNSIDLSLMKKLPTNVDVWTREDVDEANNDIAQALGYGDLLDDHKNIVKKGTDRMYNELFNGDDRLPVLGQFTNDHAPWFRSVGYNPTENGEKKLAEKIRSQVTNDKGEIIPQKLVELRDALGYLSNGDKDVTLENIIGDVTSKVRRGFDMRTRDIKDPVNGYGLNTVLKALETFAMGQVANSWNQGKNATWSDAAIDIPLALIPFARGLGLGGSVFGKISSLISKLPPKGQAVAGVAGDVLRGSGFGGLYALLNAANDRHKEGLGVDQYHGDDLKNSTGAHTPETTYEDIIGQGLTGLTRGAALGGVLGTRNLGPLVPRGGRTQRVFDYLSKKIPTVERIDGKSYKFSPSSGVSEKLNNQFDKVIKEFGDEYKAIGKALDTPSGRRSNNQNILVEIAKQKGKNGNAYDYMKSVENADKTTRSLIHLDDNKFHLGAKEMSVMKKLLNDKNTPPNIKYHLIKAMKEGEAIKEYTQGKMFLDALTHQATMNGVYNKNSQLHYTDLLPAAAKIFTER